MESNTFETNKFNCPARAKNSNLCSIVTNYCTIRNCIFYYWGRVKEEETNEESKVNNRETEKSKD